MNPAVLKRLDPIPILSFLHSFKTTCDSNGIHEEAAMGLFQNFMNDRAKVAFAHPVCTTENDDLQSERKLTTFCQVVNYLLATYAIEKVIAKEGAKITNFKQTKQLSAVRYLEALWEKALHCARVYEEARIKGVFIKVMHESLRFSMRTY